MRYKVAVDAMLRRVSANRVAVVSEIPPSAYHELSSGLYRSCWNIMKAPTEEDVNGIRRVVSKHTTGQRLVLSDEVLRAFRERVEQNASIFILLMEMTDEGLELKQYRDNKQKLLQSLFYTAPLLDYSEEVISMIRALMWHLLPRNVELATTAHLVITYVVLAMLKQGVRGAAIDSTMRSTALADTAREPKSRRHSLLSSSLLEAHKKYFTVKDDPQHQQQICAEVLRRLPPPGEHLPDDFLQTLIEARSGTEGGAHLSQGTMFMRSMLDSSSTKRVSREEFVFFLSKLCQLEIPHERATDSTAGAGSRQAAAALQSVRMADVHAPVFARALADLCLVRYIDKVMAARPLALHEWALLIETTAGGKGELGATGRAALKTAMRIAEQQRREAGNGALDETLFKDLTEQQQMLMIRKFASGCLVKRREVDELTTMTSVSPPLLLECARILRGRRYRSLEGLIPYLKMLQLLFFIDTVLWNLDKKQWAIYGGGGAATTGALDEEEDIDAEAAASLPRLSIKGVSLLTDTDAFLDAVAVLCHELDDALLSEAGAPSAAAVPRAVGTPVRASETPKRGAGFAKCAGGVPSPPSPSSTHSAPWWSARYRTWCANTQRELMCIQLSHAHVVLKRAVKAGEYPSSRLLVSLRLVAKCNETLAPMIEAVRLELTERQAALDTVPRAAQRESRYHHNNNNNRSHTRQLQQQLSASPILSSYLDHTLRRSEKKMELLRTVMMFSKNPEFDAAMLAETLRAFVAAVEQACDVLLIFQQIHVVHHRMGLLARKATWFIVTHDRYRAAHPAAAESTAELAEAAVAAVRRLSRLSLESVSNAGTPQEAARQQNSNGGGSSTFSLRPMQATDLTTLLNNAFALGLSTGLTSEDLPHTLSAIQDGFHTLTEAAKQRVPTGAESLAAAQQKSLLLHYSSALFRMCELGIDDAKCITAAEKALRYCGTDANVKVMSYAVRRAYLQNTCFSLGVLTPRASTSREHRQLISLLLAVAARMTAERLSPGENAGQEKESAWSRCRLAVRTWQTASMCLGAVSSGSQHDRNLHALLMFAKRFIVPPDSVERCPVPSPMTMEHLQRCEEALQSVYGWEDKRLNEADGCTPEETLQLVSAMVRIILRSSKAVFSRIKVELLSPTGVSLRQSLLAYVDINMTLIERFQDYIAPTLWRRITVECIRAQRVLDVYSVTNAKLSAVQLLSLDRTLQFTEAHRNAGQWVRTSTRAQDEAAAPQKYHDEQEYDAATTQLLPYPQIANVLYLQERVTDAHRRVYLVELAAELVKELAQIEAASAASTDSAGGASAQLTEYQQKRIFSARTNILKALRKFRP